MNLRLGMSALAIAMFGVGLLTGRFFEKPLPPTPVSAPIPVVSQSASLPVTNATPSPATPGAFSWRSIESREYRQYIANLRNIGCPEQTVRDIIIADVANLYAAKKRSLAQARPYWSTPVLVTKTNEDTYAMGRARLAEEERRLIFDLLGVDLEAERDKTSGDDTELSSRLAFLPPEKFATVRALMSGFQRREAGLTAGFGVKVSEDQFAQVRALRAEQRSQLEQILSPTEMEEFDLRTHPRADTLRTRLLGFNATPEEFKTIFNLSRSVDEKYPILSGDNWEAMERRKVDLAELDAKIKAALGPGRADEYARSWSADYRRMTILAESYNLPLGTANTLYDLNRQLDQAVQQVRLDSTMDLSSRRAAEQKMRTEAAQKIGALLGPAAMADYRRLHP